MMDLLVQITTAHKLSPGSHAIHAIGDRGILPYKPSTPIGELYYAKKYFQNCPQTDRSHYIIMCANAFDYK